MARPIDMAWAILKEWEDIDWEYQPAPPQLGDEGNVEWRKGGAAGPDQYMSAEENMERQRAEEERWREINTRHLRRNSFIHSLKEGTDLNEMIDTYTDPQDQEILQHIAEMDPAALDGMKQRSWHPFNDNMNTLMHRGGGAWSRR